MILITNAPNHGSNKMSDDNENDVSGSFTYYAFEDEEELQYEGEPMARMAELINELGDEGRVKPLTEASTILQDYMDAWVMWKQYAEAGQAEQYSYSEFLFNVVAKRAIFISVNIQ